MNENLTYFGFSSASTSAADLLRGEILKNQTPSANKNENIVNVNEEQFKRMQQQQQMPFLMNMNQSYMLQNNAYNNMIRMPQQMNPMNPMMMQQMQGFNNPQNMSLYYQNLQNAQMKNQQQQNQNQNQNQNYK
jgi:hypothetical protein